MRNVSRANRLRFWLGSLTTAAICAIAPPSLAADTPAPARGSYPVESYLNIRSVSGGTLSPDGSRVAFLTNITGFNQVWVVDSRGGWPEQLTFFPDRVQFVDWSPAMPKAQGTLTGPLLFGKDI